MGLGASQEISCAGPEGRAGLARPCRSSELPDCCCLSTHHFRAHRPCLSHAVQPCEGMAAFSRLARAGPGAGAVQPAVQRSGRSRRAALTGGEVWCWRREVPPTVVPPLAGPRRGCPACLYRAICSQPASLTLRRLPWRRFCRRWAPPARRLPRTCAACFKPQLSHKRCPAPPAAAHSPSRRPRRCLRAAVQRAALRRCRQQRCWCRCCCRRRQVAAALPSMQAQGLWWTQAA